MWFRTAQVLLMQVCVPDYTIISLTDQKFPSAGIDTVRSLLYLPMDTY